MFIVKGFVIFRHCNNFLVGNFKFFTGNLLTLIVLSMGVNKFRKTGPLVNVCAGKLAIFVEAVC